MIKKQLHAQHKMLEPDEPALSARIPDKHMQARSTRDKPKIAAKSPNLFSVGTAKSPLKPRLQLQKPEEPKDSMIRQDSVEMKHQSAQRPKADDREERNEELMSLLACLNE
jgi:hypothetical protein